MGRAPALALLLLAACTSGKDRYTYSGWDMPAYFPFDGERTWEMVNAQTSVSYKLIGVLQPEEQVDSDFLHAIRWTKECVGADETCVDGELVRAVTWSVSAALGARIHSYDEGSGTVVLDPPLVIAESEMKRGDIAETQTAGATWASENLGVEACPVRWNVDWQDCLHLQVTGSASGPLAGDYWVITSYNAVAFEVTGDPGRWELSNHEYVAP